MMKTTAPFRRSRGFTLVEMMIAVTLGLIVLAALTSFFVRTSQNRRDMENNSRQIENGRYAINALRDDIALAGFYSDMSQPSSTVWNATAPCQTDPAALGFLASQLAPQMPIPILVFPDGVGRPTACTPDYLAGTDVVVVRRFNTEAIPVASASANQVYVQISECASDDVNTPFVINTGSSGAFTLRALGCGGAAALRQFHEHLYYVRNYSVTAGDGIPTLVRVELSNGASNFVPLVEGIDVLRVELGVDNNSDGLPDVWTRCDASSPCTATSYANVMGAKIHVLSRNIDPSNNYTDDKTYNMGMAGSTTAYNDHYKRHAYSAQVAMPNRSGPREPAFAT